MKNINKLNYQEIESELSKCSVHQLIELLNSPSTKVGDTAASLLRKEKDALRLVAQKIIADQLRSRKAKIRATNILIWSAPDTPETYAALVHLIDDRDKEVISNALFGLVLLKKRQAIPLIEKARSYRVDNEFLHERYGVAVRALSEDNLALYAPNYKA